MTGPSSAPVQEPNTTAAEDEEDEQAPRFEFTRRKVIAFVIFVVLALVALYFLLPKLAGLEDTWHRIEQGSPLWLIVAFLCTCGMFGGYVTLFHGIFVRGGGAQLSWRESYEITMAGLAATRLLSAGGAGGLVLTAWALRRKGMSRQDVADKTIAFLVLTYLVYTLALVVCGFGLHFGVLPGPDPFPITFVPAVLALVVTVLGLSLGWVPPELQQKVSTKLAAVPATVSAGIRDALRRIRSRDHALLGALLFWGFQIAVLWASFKAFGEAPALAVIIMGFFVGMLGNLLPLPGGIGGVDGGMIGAFAAFGENFELAAVAVLTYRAFTFWLPTLPGVIAYLQLRRTVERWRLERRREHGAAAAAV